MAGLFKVLGIILLTLFLMIATTAFHPGTWRSVGEVAGYPVVEIQEHGARGVIAIGQSDARGIVTVAQEGYGLITFAQVGVGVLFGVGQGIGGLVGIGQLCIGLLFALGQLAIGLQSLGQLAFVKRRWLSEMSSELTALLAVRFQGNFRPTGEQVSVSDEAVIPALPDTLLASLETPKSVVHIKAGHHNIAVHRDQIVILNSAGEHVDIIRDGTWGVAQVTRSRHRRFAGGLRRWFGGDAWEHRLHLELRHRAGVRVSVHAAMERTRLEGIPWMEQSGARVSQQALQALLAVALNTLQIGLAHNPAMQRVVAYSAPATLPPSTRVFHGVKWLLRPAVWALHLAPFAVLPKLAMRAFEAPESDWITVCYVGILVYFFSVLALLALLFPMVGPGSTRYARWRPSAH